MTTRPDPDPVISAWLNDEAAERAPERLLSTTRTRIESTKQRRAWRPAWRLQTMNNRVLGGAVAAIAVIVVLAFVLIPRPAGTGGPVQTPTPVPTASPSQRSSQVPSPISSSAASPSAAASLAVIPPGLLCATDCLVGTLETGTYSFAAGRAGPTPLTFAVPAGWADDADGFVTKHSGAPNEVLFSTWTVKNVFTDACHWQATMVSSGTSVDQLASLLAAEKGRVATAPKNVTVGGLPAKRIQFTTPTSLNLATCDSGIEHYWPDPDGTTNGGICCLPIGSTDVVYVVSVTGQRLLVLTRQAAGAAPADVAELNAIVASIKFPASSTSPAPSGASPSP